MKHYEIENWLDFVHGLGKETDRGDMGQHLASGCEPCNSAVGMLRKIVTAAAADGAYQVPDYAVRSARAIFALQRPEKVHILPRILAKLVFDSFREPVLAGVRGQQRITRQAMYEAGDYYVDLRMEHERGGSNVVLVGQIANRKEPGRKMADVPVLLMSGKEVLGQARSNQFGEFQMEYQPKKSLQLFVPVQQSGKQIEVRLNDLLKPKPQA